MPPLIPYEVALKWTVARETSHPPIVQQLQGDLVPPAPPMPVVLGSPVWPRLQAAWTTTKASTESLGQQRLRELRYMAGTGLWRPAKLVPKTVDAAVDFLLSFESIDGAPQPRIAPADDGSIIMEWEHEQREVLVELGSAGHVDILLVDNGTEIREGAAEATEAPDLARWLLAAHG